MTIIEFSTFKNLIDTKHDYYLAVDMAIVTVAAAKPVLYVTGWFGLWLLLNCLAF